MASKYKVNQGFITQKLKDKIVIFSGERSMLYTLNETAAYVFNGIKLGWTEEKISQSIQRIYKVNEKTVKEDIENCLKDLLKKKILNRG